MPESTAMHLSKYVAQAKFEYRSIVSRYPWLAPLHKPIIWWTQYKMKGRIDTSECQITHDTEFVLDGFQGSGNSYATVAFKSAQERPVRIAHHLHAPAQIIKAVGLDIPTIVTLRAPEKAVVSLISRWPYVGFRQAFRSYIGFYEMIEPHADGFVISPFNQTINHLDQVIEALNRKFETDFAPYHPDGVTCRNVRSETTLDDVEERERAARKKSLSREVQSKRYEDIIRKANAVYDRFLSKPSTVGT